MRTSGYLGRMPAEESIRVVTYNVFGPANPDWDRRLELIGSTLRGLDPDVVALQEVPVEDDAFFDDLLGPGYHVSHFSESSDDGVAGTLATRWPQRRIAEIDLRLNQRSRDALPWTAAVLSEIDTPLGTMIVTHHKPSWPFPFEAERLQQAVLVAGAIEEHIDGRDLPAIVLGDFDATPDSASMSFWRGRLPVD